MRYILFPVGVLVFSIVGTSSCKDADDATDKIHINKDLKEAADDFGAAVCHGLFNCPVDSVSADIPFDNEASCTEAASKILFDKAVATPAGAKIHINKNSARNCLDALNTRCYPETGLLAFNTIPACREAFKGTVEINDACNSNNECVSQNCHIENDHACGTCAATTKDLDEGCNPFINECNLSAEGHVDCVEGSDGSGFTCQLVYEHITADIGEDCGAQADGRRRVCALGLFCNDEQKCVEGVKFGEECTPGLTACDVGSVCKAADGGATGVCTQIYYQTTAGAPCDPENRTGEACAFSEGLFCQESTKQCTSIEDIDGMCLSAGDCDEGEYCNNLTTCTRFTDEGKACTGGDQCASGLCGKDNNTAERICLPANICN